MKSKIAPQENIKKYVYPNLLWIKFCFDGKPRRGEKITDGGVAPGIEYPNIRKPRRGERSFVPSALLSMGPNIHGGDTPACGLDSLSGLGSYEQNFPQ